MSDFTLDIRTAVLSYVVITIISSLVIVFLLKQYRNRYRGVNYMLGCFGMQTVTLILILLRGNIPVWMSFDMANIISVAGIIFFYVGIELYIGIKNSLVPNLFILGVFIFIHSWFTILQPYAEVRHLNISILWLAILVQCTWSLFFRIPRSKMRITLPVTLVSTGFCLVAVLKIIKFIVQGRNLNAFLEADLFDTITVFISQILLLLLTFSLQHMFGNRLLMDIKAEEEKFSKAFHTSPVGLVITRLSNEEIVDINNGFMSITGMAGNELYGRKTGDFKFWLTKGDNSLIREELRKNGRISGLEFQFRRKSGEIATCLLSSEILTISNEECILSSIDDITERKKYELQLIASKEKAEESDRCKTAFLQNISHEIRTPLNAIVGFSSLLGEDDLDSEARKSYVDLITKSSEHLLTILNDIMEISNIEAGVVKFNKQEVNINLLMNDLYRQFRYRALDKGIDLRLMTDKSLRNPVILTDSTKLIQVLSNLLNNSLKFTEKGRIKYGYELKNNHLEFHVSDTGIGIPPDMYDRIFDRFYRIDHSAVKKYSGTGLGLAISKAFIELLGGEIWLKSEVGKGTTFYFTLPRIHF